MCLCVFVCYAHVWFFFVVHMHVWIFCIFAYGCAYMQEQESSLCYHSAGMPSLSFLCMCIFIPEHGFTHTVVHMHGEAKYQPPMLFLWSCSIYFFRHNLTVLGKIGWSTSPPDPYVLMVPALGLQTNARTSGF